MKWVLTTTVLLVIGASIGCQNSNPAAAPGGSPTSEGIPASLQNDAYHYYGLSRTEPATYSVTIDAQKADTGTETVKFLGMENGKAKYSIERTGALAQLGSEQVALDDKGVTVIGVSPGQLEGTPLDMPATLSNGTTWKTDYKVVLPGANGASPTNTEDHSTFKVVGPQKVTTKAGTFDAILVESQGQDTMNSASFNLKTQSWYAKDQGVVKVVVTTTSGGKATTLTIEAVPGSPK